MIELKEYFSGRGQVKGYVFNQIRKTDWGFIYEVKGVDTIHYEIFKHRENSMFNCVSYPTDKAFGLWAWTSNTLQGAIERLDFIKTAREEFENGNR